MTDIGATGTITEIPGLITPLSCGFNARTASYLTNPVFNVTYEKTQGGKPRTVKYDGVLCNIPDQIVTFDTATNSSAGSTAGFFNSTYEFDQVYRYQDSLGVAGIDFSGSLSQRMTYSRSMFSSYLNAYYLSFSVFSTYGIRRADVQGSDMTADFVSELEALPGEIRGPDDYAAYVRFFEAYGTHFVLKGDFGGYQVMGTDLDASFLAQSDTSEVAQELDAAFSGAVRSGTLNAASVYAQSEYLSSIRANLTFAFDARGGVPNSDVDTYRSSVFGLPVLLLNLNLSNASWSTMPEMRRHSTLIPFELRRMTMNLAIEEYLRPSLIDSPVPRTLDVSRQAQRSSFVVGWLEVGGNTRSGLDAYTDGSLDPVTLRGTASAHFNLESGDKVGWSAYTMPVRQGDYAYATLASDTFAGEPAVRIWQFGFDRLQSAGDTPLLGEWQSMGAGSFSGTADTDGFMVAVAQATGDHSQAVATVKVSDELRGACAAQKYVDDDIWYPSQSVCVPIRNGEAYDVAFTVNAGTAATQAYWIPMFASVATLGAAQPLGGANVAIPASDDGFLVILLDVAFSSATRANVVVRIAPTAEELDSDGAQIAAIGVENWTKLVNIPYRSLMVPVPRGMTFRIDLQLATAAQAMSAWWFPLIDAQFPVDIVATDLSWA